MTQDDMEAQGPVEIAFVGDLTDHAADLMDKLLSVPAHGACTLYFDSPGGSPYCAVSLMTIMILRDLQCTGIVCGECSSAAIWPFAVCQRRIVTPYSVLLFHPMKWQSEEHVHLPEAAEIGAAFRPFGAAIGRAAGPDARFAPRAFAAVDSPGRMLTGPEFAEAGLAEMIDVVALARTPALRKRLKLDFPS